MPRGKATLEDIISKGTGDQAFQPLDAKWLEAMATYASGWGLEAVTPFWTQTFFLYLPEDAGGLDWSYNSKVVEALAAGKRTDTFRAYQGLARRYGARAH